MRQVSHQIGAGTVRQKPQRADGDSGEGWSSTCWGISKPLLLSWKEGRGDWNQWEWDRPLKGIARNRPLPHHPGRDSNVTWGCGKGAVPGTRLPLKVPHRRLVASSQHLLTLTLTCTRNTAFKGPGTWGGGAAAGAGRRGPICQLGCLDPGLGCGSAPNLGQRPL